MESIIIRGIRHLHFLPNYYQRMDELAKDLNNALDDSSDRRHCDDKVKRSKPWKCRSKSKSAISLRYAKGKSSAKSDDSESSLDNWIHHKMELSTNGSYQHTDSDSILCKANKNNFGLISWRHCSAIVAESDSVNENITSREPRRKRKFKRMSVDPPCGDHDFKSVSEALMFSQKNKRLRNLKSQKISKLGIKSPKFSKVKSVCQVQSKVEAISTSDSSAAASGKRKRNIECSGCDCTELISCSFHSGSQMFDSINQMECTESKSHEINTSSVSSSESECGILTNDEGREADDEHSDYFQDPEFSARMQNFSPLWEDDRFLQDEEEMHDSRFQDVLSENYFDVSEAAHKMYDMQVSDYKSERQIKSGRRRLGKPLSLCRTGLDDFSPVSPLKNECGYISSIDNCLAKTTLNEKKKRKGMPSPHGFGEFCMPVTDSNTTVQTLRSTSCRSTFKSSRSVGVIPLVFDDRLDLIQKSGDKTPPSSIFEHSSRSPELSRKISESDIVL